MMMQASRIGPRRSVSRIIYNQCSFNKRRELLLNSRSSPYLIQQGGIATTASGISSCIVETTASAAATSSRRSYHPLASSTTRGGGDSSSSLLLYPSSSLRPSFNNSTVSISHLISPYDTTVRGYSAAAAATASARTQKRKRQRQRAKERKKNADVSDEYFFSSSKQHNSNNRKSKRNRQKQNKNKKKADEEVDLKKLVGPSGRAALACDKRSDKDTLLEQLGLPASGGNMNPMSALQNAKQRMDFALSLHHECLNPHASQPLFLVTLKCTFQHPQDLQPYMEERTSSSEQQYFVPNYDIDNDDEDDWDTDDDDDDTASRSSSTDESDKNMLPSSLELTALGVDRSKKGASTLAAMDALLQFQELGIITESALDPPNFVKQRRAKAQELAQRVKKEEERAAKEAYKQDLAKAQMILELLGTSRPTFTVTEAAANDDGSSPRVRKKKKRFGNQNQWIATASCNFRRQVITATGKPATKKSEAEGKAVIELIACPEFEEIVGGSAVMQQYQTLIDASPSGHVVPLHVPPLGEDWLEELFQTVGSYEDHTQRKELHQLAKEEYQFSLQERNERMIDRQKYQQQQHDEFGSQQQQQHMEQQIEMMNDYLRRQEYKRMNKAMERPNGTAAKMKSIRDALPIKKIQNDLIDALKTDQVIVVSGGTGSGKSTQCPQYILEDALLAGKGVNTNIIVTQPRKIAAVSVAERVAAERTEGIGHSVGYSVRFNRKAPRDNGGTVEFVTTGVLLRRLINDPTLEGCSHVMIDEVHERDIQTDFLLVLLRDLLKTRPDLRVILMSATLDADSFGRYFSDLKSDGDVRVLKVPTRPRHPVEVFYLEDLETTMEGDYAVKSIAKSLLEHNDAQLRIDLEEALAEEEAGSQLEARSRAEDEGGDLDSSDSESSDSEDEEDVYPNTKGIPDEQTRRKIETLRRALEIRNTNGHQSNVVMRRKTLSDNNFDARDAIVDLVCKVAQNLTEEETNAGRSGSILCFLPGWDEIKAATGQLEKLGPRLRQSMTILPLHSTIPHDDQKKVFEPANGKIKVILATNIAESSVTINDVLAVVDSGLVRELNYNPQSNSTAMETNKTSQASATQRLGRAGRVDVGKCYRLYSRGDFEAMPERQRPEIQRTALEATCLQTCSMTSKGVGNFLSQALDPPPRESVTMAMDRLVKLGAINITGEGEKLSPLGNCLSRLPLDPAIGRMLIMGVVMKCLDPLLTSAACFSSRNVFYSPLDHRDEAQAVRRSFSDKSDIMATVKAYDMFWETVEEDGWDVAKDWAYDNFVSIAAMVSIKAVRSQLIEELKKIGMIPSSDVERRARKSVLLDNASVNENAHNEKLYSAIWAVAFPGNLAARRRLGSFGTLRTRLDSHAGLHPSAVGFHRQPPKDKEERRNLPSWYLYQEMVLSSQLFLRGSSAMEPEQILLFGGYRLNPMGEDSADGDAIGRKRRNNVLGIIDDWVAVEGVCGETVQSLSLAREAVNTALEHKVMFPKADLPEPTQAILDVVADILDEEGKGGGAETDDELLDDVGFSFTSHQRAPLLRRSGSNHNHSDDDWWNTKTTKTKKELASEKEFGKIDMEIQNFLDMLNDDKKG